MHSNVNRWLIAQLDTTSAEVCRLLSIGRLSGVKQKDPRRAGKSQWLVDPKSASREEKHRKTKLALRAQRLKHASGHP